MIGQDGNVEGDLDSWEIVQDGQTVCSQDDRATNWRIHPKIHDTCCVNKNQKYTLNCKSERANGFDYVSSSSSIIYYNGYVDIDGTKYCQYFDTEDSKDFPGKLFSSNLNNLQYLKSC